VKAVPDALALMLVALALWLLAAGPTEAPPLGDLLLQGKHRLEAGDLAGARRALIDALHLYPESPAVHNFLGALEAAEGNYRAAEKHFREALSRSPRFTDASLNLGRLYQENADKDEDAAAKALRVYAALLAYEPQHVEAHYQSAVLQHALGEFGPSLEHLDRLPSADQERPSALALRCADQAGLGESARAEEAAARLLERRDVREEDLRPILATLLAHGAEDLRLRLMEALRLRGLVEADGLRWLATAYEKQDRLELARQALEEAARDRQASVPLLVDLARVAHKAGDYKGALGYLAHARNLEPGNAGIHFFFGMVCVSLDLGVEAFNSLREAVRLEPENPHFNYALGAVSLHRRDPSEAIPYFRKYADLRADDIRGRLAIGIAAFKAGDYATARTELRKAAPAPETAAAAHYFLARIAREENDVDEALRLVQKALAANPSYADAHAELGLLYLRKHEPERAEQALGRCLELDPDNYLGNYHLLMLYQRTKDARERVQSERFEELKQRKEVAADEFRRVIEVRPY
jgi:tetratricopeptide (TPR) repeat protein